MRKFLCRLLALTMVLSLMAVPASAIEQAPSAGVGSAAEHWFYDQLSASGKAIYNALWDMYQQGMMKDGKTSYDLADGVVSQEAISAYLNGDRTLFNDFSAAKDAFDLEHPEVWYVDSSYLSLRVTQDASGKYHAYMGPGRSDNYYVAGVKDSADVDEKTREINAAIDAIVKGAQAAADSSSTETFDSYNFYAADVHGGRNGTGEVHASSILAGVKPAVYSSSAEEAGLIDFGAAGVQEEEIPGTSDSTVQEGESSPNDSEATDIQGANGAGEVPIMDGAENPSGSSGTGEPAPNNSSVTDTQGADDGGKVSDIPNPAADEAENSGGGSGAGGAGTAYIPEKDMVTFNQVRYVHEQITKRISYRFENECRPENAGYLRTVYGLVTHEGVCECYARSMQLVLNRLGIPCVLVHGLQTSGTPEDHMWNAVQISGEWYVVDATWDDPVGMDADGKIKAAGRDGEDGSEVETYLLVGQDVVGANWQPSGYVSTGTMEFEYPGISLVSFGGGVIEKNGLTITYADDLMEGLDATVYRVSFNGDGLVQAAKKGIYFLVKMYDLNADGSWDQFDEWYYMVHGMHSLGRNDKTFDPDSDFQDTTHPYYRDSPSCLTMIVSNVEYVEFAVTTKAPPNWRTAMDLVDMGGFYSGDYSDILAETGLIFNANGGYEQPPYVKNVSPMFNSAVNVGPTYTIHIEFTDSLYHPDQASIDNTVPGKINDAAKAMNQDVVLDYTGTNYSWGENARQPHEFANKPAPQNVRWVCEAHGSHSGMSEIDAACRLTTLEFEFSASRMWADDSVEYEFYLTGLVGVKSNKFICSGVWSYVFENPSAHCSYRKAGIDWNLWGQPQLLDNPDGIDLSKMVVEGVGGNQQSLEDLRSQMHLDDYDMNGRLMLVVENLGGSRSSVEELSAAISREESVDIPADAVLGSFLYEIDFARICRNTIVKTGQSLRMSVGFPKGFDASMAGIVFKAYHFTRNDDGEIISVEELPITVTPYGLVVMCDSFSPFEIVALKSGSVGEEPSAGKSVVILADEGGQFLRADGTPATGKNGIVTLAKGQHVTLKVQSDDEHVATVMFDGRQIPVSSDGTVVISYEDIESSACFLSTSSISKVVLEADEKEGMTLIVPDAPKKASSSVSGRLETAPGTAPDGSMEVGSESGDSGNSGGNAGGSGNSGGSENPGGSGNGSTGSGDSDHDSSGGDSGSSGGTGNSGSGSSGSHHGNSSGGSSGVVSNGSSKNGNQKPGSDTVDEPGISFSDVAASAYYYDAVLWAYENGITGGTTATTFSPDNPCTRAQVMTFLWRAAGEPEPESFVNPFGDVSADAYYHKAILWAYEQGITGGTTPTTFAPNATCTRAQVVTFLWRAKGEPVSGAGNSFGDVAANSYYSNAVNWAVERGITGGTTATTFSPDSACTRAHVVTFLYRDLAG